MLSGKITAIFTHLLYKRIELDRCYFLMGNSAIKKLFIIIILLLSFVPATVCSENRMSTSPRLPPIGFRTPDLNSPRPLLRNTPKEMTRDVTRIDPGELWDLSTAGVLYNFPKPYIFPISIFINLPSTINVSEIQGKIIYDKQPTLSELKKIIPIFLAFFISPFCEVPDLSRLLQQPSHPKHHSFRSRDFPPKRVPTQASYLAPIKPPGMQRKPENQTDSKLFLFHPTKNPQSQHKVWSITISTQILLQ